MKNTFRVLLVDDETAARKALRELLEEHPGIEVVGEADSAATALALFQKHSPQLVFLDIQMPEEDGFSLLPKLQPPPAIVFVTAYDKFAVRAFEINAVDYLMKPVPPERLAKALERAQCQQLEPTGPYALSDPILMHSDAELIFVPAMEIACIEADGNYCRVHVLNRHYIHMRRSMANWESLLPQPPFYRVHRSLMVNLRALDAVTPESYERATLAFTGSVAPVTVARRALRRLKNALEDFRKT